MFTVTVNSETSIHAERFNVKILLSDALEKMGIMNNKPCGGNGTCGKCRVLANRKSVLACQTYICEDTYVNYNTNLSDVQGITEMNLLETKNNPLLEDGYGMAIDIGTTTIAAYLYSFPECRCIKKTAVPNHQAIYGADVISRIEYSNGGGLENLREEVLKQISELSEGYDIKKYVITGNTTMLHLFNGNNPQGIAVAPFTPETLFGQWYKNIYVPRCISAYVGADITTAILASGMLNNETSLLVDIGTNGEMALWHNNELICCSTAAGPAFEGAGISSGVMAVNGAINKVYIEDDKIRYTTIGDASPTGICGTGLIDAIACMTQIKAIDETGYLEKAWEIAGSGIFITPEDVRNVQLAKSAIRSGIDALLNHCNLRYDDIGKFYIAGGFGSYINKVSAAKTGLIPYEVTDKCVVVGNGAGAGAVMILLDKNNIEKTNHIAENAKTLELSTDAFFMEKYIDNMMF